MLLSDFSEEAVEKDDEMEEDEEDNNDYKEIDDN